MDYHRETGLAAEHASSCCFMKCIAITLWKANTKDSRFLFEGWWKYFLFQPWKVCSQGEKKKNTVQGLNSGKWSLHNIYMITCLPLRVIISALSLNLLWVNYLSYWQLQIFRHRPHPEGAKSWFIWWQKAARSIPAEYYFKDKIMHATIWFVTFLLMCLQF